MVFAAFFKKEKHFPGVLEQISKSLLDGVTIGDRMTKKNAKSEKMGAKFVRTTSAI